ncbi:MAG TPA: sulfite reductase subunit A, partial [Kiloniellaceae bacterium]|nr:sulfite reductase subunit A [Kiloniellaceae bacterium]
MTALDRAAAEPVDRSVVIPAESLDALLAALRDGGYQVWGAQERDGALALAPLAAAADLP